MVDIPEGEFIMGDTEGTEDEISAHKVKVSAFKMNVTEVTCAQWDSCIADGGCSEAFVDKKWDNDLRNSIVALKEKGWAEGNLPVINVSYEQITEEYIPWLYRKTGLRFDLPTEEQWEYAARAGTITPFYLGEDLKCSDANFGYHGKYRNNDPCGREKEGMPKAVGSYASNSFGLYDMHGNVSEITKGLFYQKELDDPNLLERARENYENVFTVKGGSFESNINEVKVFERVEYSSSKKDKLTGFRLVLNPTNAE